MNEYNIQVSLFEWNYWHKSTFWWYSNYMTSTCTLSELFFDVLVFCCCSLTTFRFDALCVQRCSSAYHYCNAWLFALLSPSFSFDQSGYSPLTSLINIMYLPTELLLTGFFCFSHHPLQTIISRSNSLRLLFFPILTFGLNNSWTSWWRMHVFYMHLVPVTWLADYIVKLTSCFTGLPNKLLTECTYQCIDINVLSV